VFGSGREPDRVYRDAATGAIGSASSPQGSQVSRALGLTTGRRIGALALRATRWPDEASVPAPGRLLSSGGPTDDRPTAPAPLPGEGGLE
jgi:hypothetical protein